MSDHDFPVRDLDSTIKEEEIEEVDSDEDLFDSVKVKVPKTFVYTASSTPSASTATTDPLKKKEKKKSQSPVIIMSTIGSLTAFQPSTDDFDMWYATFLQFLLANGIDQTKSEDRCRAILLSSVGIETYSLLATLLSPDAPETKSLADIKSTLSSYYKPAPKMSAERFRFSERKQQQGESLHQFEAALRKLAQHCKFGSELNHRIRDQFMFGLLNESAQHTLFAKDDQLTLQDAVSIAVALESAKASTAIVRGKVTPELVEVNQVAITENKKQKKIKPKTNQNQQQSKSSQGNSNTPSTSRPRMDSQTPCHRCGNDQHTGADCWAKTRQCHKCQKTGHIASVCRSATPSETLDIKHLSLESISDIRIIQSSGKCKVLIDVTINGLEH